MSVQPERNRYAAPESKLVDIAAGPPTERPQSVTVALLLLYGSLLIFAVYSGFYFKSKTHPNFVLITVSVGAIALFSWLYYQIALGRNWARVTVVSVVGALLVSGDGWYYSWRIALYGVGAIPNYNIGVLVVQSTLNLVSVVLILGPGRAWFRRRPQ